MAVSQMFKIFIGNVSFKTTEEQLRPFFASHLTVEDLVIARDAEGKSKGYGFVMTRDPVAGRAAMARIGKFEIDGRRVYLKEAHGKKFGPKPKRSGGGNRRGGPRPFNPDARSGGLNQRSGYDRPRRESSSTPNSGYIGINKAQS